MNLQQGEYPEGNAYIEFIEILRCNGVSLIEFIQLSQI